MPCEALDQQQICTGILRRRCRLRATAHFLLALPKAAMQCIAAIWRWQNACGRTRWVRSDIRITKKKPSDWMVSFLCDRYTKDEPPTCRRGLDQLQNQARFCKMFSLPHGSRRRICPKRLLQNRSDTVGRSYSYDILKNCTLERGEQCTICSVVYCKLMEYVV